MGIDVSSVELVSTVANHPSGRCSGSLSATALPEVYARILQLGDPEGKVREAFEACGRAAPALAAEIDALYRRFHIAGGKAADAFFRGPSMAGMTPPRDVQILTVAATFAHVWRAKKAAPGRPIGINFLRKIDRILLFGIYGAMLGRADWIVMGAGDPGDIPAIMNAFARHEPAELAVPVAAVPRGTHRIRFDPKDLVGNMAPPPRPAFYAIVSSHLQARALALSAEKRPEGFVIEGPTAGGHNAPPVKGGRDARGYCVYGPEDDADLSAVAALGLPFWIGGSCGYPECLKGMGPWHRRIQVGTLFALSKESGMAPEVRHQVLELIWKRRLEVATMANASPSMYPFKVALAPGTLGDDTVYAARKRVCDVGHLRSWRFHGDELVGLCPANDPERYTGSGGPAWRTKGSMCLCNGLLAARGLSLEGETPVVTLGDIGSVRILQNRLRRIEYTASEAVDYLLS
ncbi:MAG: nitronate monooxygenase [Elusimicrobiota bacterium]|jgi:NAD(P)H-dependent flavin oxidoreductase YrpB (nitropropane dioxygenase family)